MLEDQVCGLLGGDCVPESVTSEDEELFRTIIDRGGDIRFSRNVGLVFTITYKLRIEINKQFYSEHLPIALDTAS